MMKIDDGYLFDNDAAGLVEERFAQSEAKLSIITFSALSQIEEKIRMFLKMILGIDMRAP